MNEQEQKLNQDLSAELQRLAAEDSLALTSKPVNDGLRNDQRKAYEVLNEWAYRVYRNRDEQIFFALRGSAGTGKTTLIGKFLADLKFPYKASRVCICAPTHKAKKVLQQKTKWRNAETLQALLGLRLDTSLENFDPNAPEFAEKGDRKMKDYELVVVDEGSMVNSELFNRIVEVARQCGTKILFVGDPKQLNPVKEYHLSPCLITPVNQYELTEIIRQEKGNPLIQVLDALRHDIDEGTATYLQILKANPVNVNEKGEGYIVSNGADFGQKLKESLKSEGFREDKNFCRYISWTNQSIADTNKWIRQNVVGDVLSKETLPDGRVKVVSSVNPTIQVGEVLLGYRTIVNGDEVIITNSDDYEVQYVQEALVSDYDVPIHTHKVKLVGLDTGAVSWVHIVTKDHDNYLNYVALHKQQVAKAKSKGGRAGWNKFYEFKNDLLVLDNIYEGETLVVKKDMDYGYGITIHKSQGSTYNTVFVNGKDINKNMTDVERKRLWYVAMSRASQIVYINL